MIMTTKSDAGDPVSVEGRSGFVKRSTEKMYWILLENGEIVIVQLMASRVTKDDKLLVVGDDAFGVE